MEIAIVTNETLPLFSALLPPAEQQLLCNDPTVFALGAGVEGQACGILLLRSEETANEILYISVSPSHRRQGVATAMIEHLRDAVRGTAASLSCTFAAGDYSAPLCGLFFGCEGFDVSELDDEGSLFEVPLEDVAESLSANWVLPKGNRIEQFYSLPPAMQQKFWTSLANGRYGHSMALQQERAEMLEPLCLCVCKGDRIRSVLFFQGDDSSLLLRFAYIAHGGERGFAALLLHVQPLMGQVSPRAEVLQLAAITDAARKLVQRLFPTLRQTAQMFEARWDRFYVNVEEQAAYENEQMLSEGAIQ